MLTSGLFQKYLKDKRKISRIKKKTREYNFDNFEI